MFCGHFTEKRLSTYFLSQPDVSDLFLSPKCGDKKSLIQADELTVCIFDYQRGAHRRTPRFGAYLLPF